MSDDTDTPAPRGRPTMFTVELAEKICERISGGKNVEDIGKDPDMPSHDTIYRWAFNPPEYAGNFPEMFRRARESWVHQKAHEVVSIADEATDKDSAAAATVRLKARFWITSKLNKVAYGDSVDVTSGGEAIASPVVQLPATARDKIAKHAKRSSS